MFLESSICLVLLMPPSRLPDKPPGDGVLEGKTYDPATAEQVNKTANAIGVHYGDSAKNGFLDAVNGDNCTLVDLSGGTGRTDATTIGINFGGVGDGLELATVATHDLEHWERASEQDFDGDGEPDPDPDDGDP